MDWNEYEPLREKFGWDLVECILNNDIDVGNEKPLSPSDVAQILACVEGEHDGKDWHWILEIVGRWPRTIYLRGGCDFSGWDCQSWATAVDIWDEGWLRNTSEALLSLADQMETGKVLPSWREAAELEIFGE